jgi:VWFA-related protein
MSRIVSFVFLALVAGVLSAEQLKVDVGLINVVATVLDGRSRHVDGLVAEDFIVYEDGEPQQICHFERSEDLPVSVGVLLDTSGSMEAKIATATQAVERFLRQIHPDDEIFLVTFDDRPRLIQDFTDDRGRLASALRGVRVGGGTSLYDAVAMGVDHIRFGKHDKKALLLISDGEDTASAASFARAQRYVRESEMLVYSLGIASGQEMVSGRVGGTPTTFPTGGSTGRRSPTGIPFPGGIPFPTGGPTRLPGVPTIGLPGGGTIGSLDTLNMDVLELFGEISGGRAWRVSDNGRGDQISDALDEIANELRNQYTIGYYPGHSVQDGRWHTIDVMTEDPAYRVRHREEYFGGSEQE